MIDRLCIIGVGLIGGSLALALKKAGYCRRRRSGGVDGHLEACGKRDARAAFFG